MKNFLILLFCLSAVILSGDENFIWALDKGRISLQIKDKCYLYKNELRINAFDSQNKTLTPVIPHGISYDDEFSGKTQIIPAGKYLIHTKENIPVTSAKISYQGCKSPSDNEPSLCFMPQDITLGFPVVQQQKNTAQTSFLNDFKVIAKHEGTMTVKEMLSFLDTSTVQENSISANPWADKSVLLILFILLSGGFMLNFTPCILPMIPINLAIIGAGGEKTPLAGFLRGVYYAVGMTCAYGVLGIAVVVSGARFGELNTNMYFNFVIAAIFFALSLAMAGVWNLDFSAKLNSINPMKWKIGRPLAIFLMGATAALLGGACVAPAVISMLLLAVTLYETSPAAGLAVPFVFGSGMGILWIAAGATMGKILPKPGKWMVYVKNILAVVIALFGIYYAFIGFSLIPGRFDAAAEVAKLQKAMSGSDRKIFIDFYATWCKNCTFMDKKVLSAPEIKEKLKDFTVIKFQAEDLKNAGIAGILKHYNIQGLPSFVILERK